MANRALIIALTAGLLFGCSGDDDRNIPDLADAHGMQDSSDFTSQGYSDENITSDELGDLVPGTQEELIAMIGDRVFFSFNSANLTDNAQHTLRRQAEWLKEHQHLTITVEGHCDERGTREYNLALGERRAAAVKRYLENLGVQSGRITVISYGKEHPEYLGSNEVAWSKNRRSVTVVN